MVVRSFAVGVLVEVELLSHFVSVVSVLAAVAGEALGKAYHQRTYPYRFDFGPVDQLDVKAREFEREC